MRNVRLGTDLSILASRTALCNTVSLVWTVFCNSSLCSVRRSGWSTLLRFPTNIKGCYVTALQQVKTCFCARDELCNTLVVAFIHSSVSQSVCTALWSGRRKILWPLLRCTKNACPVGSKPSKMLQQITQAWRLGRYSKNYGNSFRRMQKEDFISNKLRNYLPCPRN
jgi:hypothetical protein